MAKDAVIQIRISEKDKAELQKRAESMYMSMSAYLVHAGMVYIPSERVQKAQDNINKLWGKLIEDPVKLQKYLDDPIDWG